MAETRKRVGDVDVMNHYVRAEWEPGNTDFVVTARILDANGIYILSTFQRFKCSEDGWITRTVYNQAGFYALALAECVDEIRRVYRRKGEKVYSEWDIKQGKHLKDRCVDPVKIPNAS